MTGPEATLERQCVRLARTRGGELLKLVPAHVRGLPDRLLLMPGGRGGFVELKSPQGRLTPLQRFWQTRLRELGFRYSVIRSIEEFNLLLDLVSFEPESKSP